jgi:hypothetical protein
LASSGRALPIHFTPDVIHIRIANEFNMSSLRIPKA